MKPKKSTQETIGHHYAVFQDDNGRLLPVKDGWSWPAFLYGPFWAIYRQLWRAVCWYGAVILICALLERNGNWFTDQINFWFTTMAFCMSIAMGMGGNTLLRKRYVQRGYKQVSASVQAESEEALLQRYRLTPSTRQEKRAQRTKSRRQK